MYKKIIPMLLIVLLVALGIFLIYAFFVEPNLLSVAKLELSFRDLPDSADGIRILQISDLHYSGDAPIYEKTLKTVEKLNPDVIVIIGDFVGNKQNYKSVEYCKRIVSLGKPVFAVMGNWDHHSFTYELVNRLEKVGVNVLINTNVEFKPYFYIAGTDDSYTGFANLDKTFSCIPDNGAFVLLLTHCPDIIYDAVKYHPKLVLCGHTHGGQVKIPFTKKALYVPSKYGSRFIEGLFKIDGVYMYVNRGIGNSHLRVRFLSKPEVTLITLHKN